MTINTSALCAAAILVCGVPRIADAFCGFYVSGSGGKMFNDATQVVLVREGTRTVLAMQNDYKGPLEDFAMVVPVPVVLKEADVKTLKKGIFERVESMGSPRLVEYWEQDPCPPDYGVEGGVYGGLLGGVGYGAGGGGYGTLGMGSVKVEAKFDVAEYQIVILSATEAAGLQDWLKANNYKIPEGAEPLLRPYVEAGSKFFVAKVDPKKVVMEDGRAALSPLRFHYDSEEFSLPIRLGMANSSGKQDLIVNIISPDKRYEVANYKNVFIPTNVDVKTSVKSRFPEFYASLFDQTIAANPGAVVTEYAWTAQRGIKCDPCPDLQMTDRDVVDLGGDVIKLGHTYVMTRLHARYGKQDMKDDLRFREAKPVVGGREEWSRKGIEYGAKPAKENFFQARYAVRHLWTGPIKCKKPRRFQWGGPPDGVDDAGVLNASKLAFAPRGRFKLATSIQRDLWEIGFKKERKAQGATTPTPATAPKASTPAKAMGAGAGALLGLVFIGMHGLLSRRRRA